MTCQLRAQPPSPCPSCPRPPGPTVPRTHAHGAHSPRGTCPRMLPAHCSWKHLGVWFIMCMWHHQRERLQNIPRLPCFSSESQAAFQSVTDRTFILRVILKPQGAKASPEGGTRDGNPASPAGVGSKVPRALLAVWQRVCELRKLRVRKPNEVTVFIKQHRALFCLPQDESLGRVQVTDIFPAGPPSLDLDRVRSKGLSVRAPGPRPGGPLGS